MKFSENWLRSLVDIAVDRDALVHKLTMSGLEVEGVEPLGAALDGVVVAEIVGCEKHPNADKLRVCDVSIDGGEKLQIVCGAPNARVGLKAPLARIGANLPNGIEIRQAALRGVRIATGSDVTGIIGLDVRSSSGVVLDDLSVVGNSWGIRLQDVTDSTLRDSELTGNALGLEVRSAASGVVISGNQIHDNDRFWATDRSGTGIALTNAIGPITISGNGIHRNRLPSASPEDGVGIEEDEAFGHTGII